MALDPDPGHFTNLGTSLRDRYRVSGTAEDLDRAIAFHLKAVETASAPSEQAVSLNALGNALRDRYERTGEVHDLDEAISAYETALTHVDTEPLRATLLTNLANGLGDRYDRHGAPADLARSVSLLEEALAATPADSPKWWLRADTSSRACTGPPALGRLSGPGPSR